MKKTLLASVTIAVALVAGCTSINARSAAVAAAPDPVTFATYGDSITDPSDANNVPETWLRQLSTGTDTSVKYVGGYNHFGYTCGQLAAQAKPIVADVLVIACGTNDVNQGVPTATTIADIDAIRAKADVPHVLLLATPPSDMVSSKVGDRAVLGQKLNRQLVARAYGRAWLFTDPFYFVREPDNHYVEGSTVDGTHGTAYTNKQEAYRMSVYIKQAAVGAQG